LLATASGACEGARSEYEALSLELALEKADAELSFSRERSIECLEVKALSLMLLGRSDEARVTLAELFSREIEHVISDRALAPAQRAAIEEARENVRPMRAAVKARWLVHDLLRLDVVLSGGLRDAAHVRYELELRPANRRSSGVVSFVGRVATATAAIPAGLEVSTLVVSGRVIDRHERTLHAFDNESLLPPRPPPPERVASDDGGPPWFVWAGIGAGVIGASVAIALLAQPGKPPCGMTAGCKELGE
jgi:hypothetical protein